MSRLQQVINRQHSNYGSRSEYRIAEALREISMTLAMVYDKLDQIFPEQKKKEAEDDRV